MTRERLQQYRTLTLECRQLAELLTELEATMTAPKSQRLDGMPHSPSKGDNPLETIVVRHIELQARYRAKLDELTAARLEVEQAAETLPSRERQLIRWRYIEGLSWDKVCDRMNYGWAQVHRIHRLALAQLESA